MRVSDQYAAGFFDGEGCVIVRQRIRDGLVHYNLDAVVAQMDRTVLDLLKAEYGGAIHPQRKNAWKPGEVLYWRWCMGSVTAREFLKVIHPFSVVKREEIALALEFQERKEAGTPHMLLGSYKTAIEIVRRDRKAQSEVAA